jgi:hypothetical protein
MASGRGLKESDMTSKTLKSAIWLTMAAGALTLAAGGVAFGKGKPENPGGGGNKPPSEASQSLSVPAILVGTLANVTCGVSSAAPSDLVPPIGTPLTGYEEPGYYWVQKVHVWKAQCFDAFEASVYGAWGDNLTGDASLKAGSPIRVELVLTNETDFSSTGLNTIPTGTLQGYTVKKLQPSTLDRLSAYGHLAGGDATNGFTNIPVDFPQDQWVVHNAGMQLSVQNLDTSVFVVPLQPIAPEINATGKIVYGYNLRVSAAGNYQIRFNTSPTVTFTGCDAGVCDVGGTNAYLDIVVGAGGGGGGRP